MPIYEYACDKCGHEFEAEQRITDDPLKSCPECRGRKVRRLISRTSFVLKGSGWYSDLYASKGSKPEAGGSGSEAAASDTKPDAKPSETKAEAKSEPKAGSDKGESKTGKKKSPKAAA